MKIKNHGVVIEKTKQFKRLPSHDHLNCHMVLNQPAPHILGSGLDPLASKDVRIFY